MVFYFRMRNLHFSNLEEITLWNSLYRVVVDCQKLEAF